jgi:Flp pilus assembly protein CpaB
MQTTQKPPPPKKPPQRREARGILSTRGGTTLVAVISALVAAAVLMIFLNQYRDSVKDGNKTATVLVAKNLIESGSSGDVVAEDSMFQTTTVKKDELKDGAISDPSSLKGTVATADVYPGEQLLAKQFTKSKARPFNRLRGLDRAIAVPLDEAHGMVGDVQTGDRVDVLAGIGLEANGANSRPTLSVLARDLLVLKAPDKPKVGVGAQNSTQPVMLRATDRETAQIAFAADVGKVWLVARAKVGSKDSKFPTVDLQSLVLGTGLKALKQANQYLDNPPGE